METKAKSRNLGIDALRCAAMLLIVCLHILNRGGAVAGSSDLTGKYLVPLNVLAACGVNLYAMISGYVLVTGRFHPARVLELWLQVFFTNLVIGVIGVCVKPGSMDGYWLRCLFPLTQKYFWYFTAYVGVFAFSPVINRGLAGLSPRQCRALLWTMLLLFSLGSFLGYLYQGDPYRIGRGYSVLWLLALYVVGACARLCDFGKRVPSRVLALTVLVLVAGTALLRISIPEAEDTAQILSNLRTLLLDFIFPGAVGISLCLLLLFARLRVTGAAAGLVRLFAPLTFGVYIIHVHDVNWTWIKNLYRPLGQLQPGLAPLAVLAAGLGLFLACAALEWCRALVFRGLRVRGLLDRLEASFLRWLREDTGDTQ